ncbi:GAF domain-containing protein [Pseudoroseomonas ludipueritiae]|uniref:Sigma-54-dependent Fis family transcriptional regulator n=1 Tax=Pseudoroseomonas ludipueritiae TaxID=198093 RepID=A0ABR7RDU8_9PROT|nr:GAF domain-containing protein [Pseudoroseomonas ludipueritiae]MBC9179960.1 sigma-54-dependent Fis family transcriptional regulator [Pseudoroseomonas ludipueritiae]
MPARPASRHADRIYSVLSDQGAAAQSAVAASWSRSLHRHGLDPEHWRPPLRLAQAEFDHVLERMESIVVQAREVLDRLFQVVGDSGCCVLLTDRDGVPLDRRGRPGDDAGFRAQGLWTGTVWNERSEGTNGVGTALAEGRPMIIHRNQHFMTRNIGLSCIAAPIWDAEGRVMGALDVSSCRADLTPGLLKLISAATGEAAARIEARHFRQVYAGARILVTGELGAGPPGLIAVDREDLVVGASRAARLAHGLTDEKLARPFPVADLLGREPSPDSLAWAERGVIQRAMARAGGNVSAAARLLGVSRATLHRKLARLRLSQMCDSAGGAEAK